MDLGPPLRAGARRLAATLGLLLLSLVAGAARAADPDEGPRRVVLVLDNSASMRINDPQSRIRDAIAGVIGRLRPVDEVGLVAFDGRARSVHRLQPAVGSGLRERVGSSVSSLSYRGHATDLAAGLERALRELEATPEPPGTSSVVLLVTDGIMDTGSRENDIARERWLRDTLLERCRRSGVRILAVAFTDNADHDLLQAMARETGGAYFKVLADGDVAGIFADVEDALTRPAPPELPRTGPSPVAARAGPPPQSAPPPPEIRVERVEVPVPVTVPEKAPAHLTYLLVLAVLLAGGGLVVALARRRERPSAGDEGGLLERVEVTLHDLATGDEIPITRRVTKIGRRPDNDIVIDQPTLSGQHAVLEVRDGVYYLSDLRSTNGTFVNEQRLSEATVLRHGDILRFDKYKYAFEDVLEGDATQHATSGDETMVRAD